mmetsp:Transcript_3797/g.8856  ORF Transcript_3797/g.8856 Transcript_3797/m.8856 type:complete len:200 (+) Transcript_3797:1154-1753(+)
MIQRVLALHEGSLTAHLSRNLVVRKTSSGEQRQLLATNDGVHGVDGGDTGLNHLLRIDSRLGVERGSVDVQEFLGQHGGALVDRLAGAVEGAAHQVVRDGHLLGVASELDVAILVIDAAGALENLDDGLLLVDLKNLALADRAIGQVDVHDLAVGREFDIVHDDQRTLDTGDGPVVDARVHLVVPRRGGSVRSGSHVER